MLARLLVDGVIDGVARGRPSPSPWVPSVLRCALTLIGAVLGLRMLGLRRSLEAVKCLGRKAPRVMLPTPEFLAAAARKVDTAAAFFPGRALCLERSFALYAVLRRTGVEARLRIGAQPYPFAAHAWVEYDGRPVGESHDGIGRFVPFEGLGV